jgi:hypothetical protein
MAVFQENEYGDEIKCEPRLAPSSRSCTKATGLSGSEADAVIVTVLETVEPLAGALTDTVGGVVSAATIADNEIVSVGLEALLVTVTLPVMLPDAAGANMTFNVADAPGLKICPAETPLALNPAPVTETFEIVALEPPEFVIVTV